MAKVPIFSCMHSHFLSNRVNQRFYDGLLHFQIRDIFAGCSILCLLSIKAVEPGLYLFQK